MRASELGLHGWVRNLTDGRVEVQLEGSPQAIHELRLWCEHGPRDAEVALVRPSRMPLTGENWFEVRY